MQVLDLVGGADIRHDILLHANLFQADEGPQEIGVDRGACIEKDLGIGNGNRAELVGQHAVAYDISGEPVIIGLQARLQHGREAFYRHGQARILDFPSAAFRPLSGFSVLFLRNRCRKLIFLFGQEGLFPFPVQQEDLIELFRAFLLCGRYQHGIHRDLQTLLPQHLIHCGVAGPFPGDPVAVSAAFIVIQAQVEKLLSEIKTLGLWRIVTHQALIVKDASSVVVDRQRLRRLVDSYPRDPSRPRRKGIAKPLTEAVQIKHAHDSPVSAPSGRAFSASEDGLIFPVLFVST